MFCPWRPSVLCAGGRRAGRPLGTRGEVAGRLPYPALPAPRQRKKAPRWETPITRSLQLEQILQTEFLFHASIDHKAEASIYMLRKFTSAPLISDALFSVP